MSHDCSDLWVHDLGPWERNVTFEIDLFQLKITVLLGMIEKDLILIIFCFSTLFTAFVYLLLGYLNSLSHHRYQGELRRISRDDISIRKAIKELVYTPVIPEQTPLLTQAINAILPAPMTRPAPNPLESIPKILALPFKISEKVFDVSTDVAAVGVKTVFFPAFLSYRAIKAVLS